jgi:hypothetical protein
MNVVVMHVAQGHEVVDRVCAAADVVLDMVQFE